MIEMKKWEYKYILVEAINESKPIQEWGLRETKPLKKGFAPKETCTSTWEDVEELGKDGWELVSSCPSIGGASFGSSTCAVYLFFKREKKE